MPDQDRFEHRLADAFRRYSDRAPTDVDATALAREIASGSTRTGPRWWPFGREQHERWRSNTMLTVATLTGVIAALALGAGLVVPGLVAEDEVAPAGADTGLVASDWAFFEGSFEGDPERISPTEYLLDQQGLQVSLGGSYSGVSLQASDPRMDGTWTPVINEFTDPYTGDGIWSNTVTIENGDGAWTCLMTGVRNGRQWQSADSGWCDGSGAHAGLRAFIAWVERPDDIEGPDVVGYVSSGDGPPPVDMKTE